MALAAKRAPERTKAPKRSVILSIVSRACKLTSYFRQQFYEILGKFQT
jgi:hypothetical protein